LILINSVNIAIFSSFCCCSSKKFFIRDTWLHYFSINVPHFCKSSRIAIEAQLRVKSPGYAALTQPQPVTLQQIQSTLLDDNTLLLEYSLGSERSYLWVVSKTSITSYVLPKGADIQAAAEQLRKQISKPGSGELSTAASTLWQILLAPVATKLGNKRLLIVGDGALQSVPFAALPIPNTKQATPLLVEHEIISLPSASTLAIQRTLLAGRKPASLQIAVLADPVFTADDKEGRLTSSRVS
jgi:CHAT domain-containing protein